MPAVPGSRDMGPAREEAAPEARGATTRSARGSKAQTVIE